MHMSVRLPLDAWRERRTPQRQAAFAAISLVVLLCTACDVRREWQEEVELSDGSSVVISRTSVRARVGEFGGGGYGQHKEEVLEINEPISVTWRGDTRPISFDVRGSDVYVVGWLRGWPFCEKYGYPNPPFAYFRYSSQSGWVQVKPDDAPVTLKQNLLLNPWQLEVEKHRGVLSIDRKKQINRSIHRVTPAIADFHALRRSKEHDLLKCFEAPPSNVKGSPR